MPDTADRRAKVVTILNLKGGVGKTHTAWLLSSVCQERELRLMAIDTDTQGNLSNSFARDRGTAAGVELLLDPAGDYEVADPIRRIWYPCIDIVPANPTLARFDLSHQAYCSLALDHLLRAFLLVWIHFGSAEDWGLMCYPPLRSKLERVKALRR